MEDCAMIGSDLPRRINDWFFRTAGGKDRPAFFDIDTTCPALRRIDQACPQIREEALALLNHRQDVPRYHEADASQECISASTPHDWRVFYLELIGEKAEANRARCPATAAALDSVPDVFQASFSILDPGKSIPAHYGPYGGYLRYHLGLVVPREHPPTLRVRDQYHTWREGESVLFDDSLEHEVVNASTEARVVLIVDVNRPMPLPQRLTHRLVKQVARRVYARPTLRRALQHTPT
jgi:aspartyl/asparaginyl beta-hydroxylase (cupin superfamily)